jgi:Zn ribbon nucleic-acid-binding protein
MLEDAILRFSETKGFGESYFIVCPVCCNSSIRMTRWEDGTEDIKECLVCLRLEREML